MLDSGLFSDKNNRYLSFSRLLVMGHYDMVSVEYAISNHRIAVHFQHVNLHFVDMARR